MPIPTCTYLKPTGTICNSPALRGKPLCYFHLDPEIRRFKKAWADATMRLGLAKARKRTLRNHVLA